MTDRQVDAWNEGDRVHAAISGAHKRAMVLAPLGMWTVDEDLALSYLYGAHASICKFAVCDLTRSCEPPRGFAIGRARVEHDAWIDVLVTERQWLDGGTRHWLNWPGADNE
ncbi:hypothetical protein GCM10027421_09490 [Microbacterium shaanxiense]